MQRFEALIKIEYLSTFVQECRMITEKDGIDLNASVLVIRQSADFIQSKLCKILKHLTIKKKSPTLL